MNSLRSIGKIYSRIMYPKCNKSSEDPLHNSRNGNRIKFEVKLKIGEKYESRSLEIRRRFAESGKQEWVLYVVKYADYTSYDYFSLSNNLITQLFDDTNSKCTLVLVESVLRFKMRSLSDKWRFVEFIRANLEFESHYCSGTLGNSPHQRTASLPIHVYFFHTCIVFISKDSQKVLAHKSIFDFEFLVFNGKTLSFVCKTSQKTSEFWSIHIENQKKLFELLTESIEIRDLPIPIKHVKSEVSEYVQIPSIHSFYTDF